MLKLILLSKLKLYKFYIYLYLFGYRFGEFLLFYPTGIFWAFVILFFCYIHLNLFALEFMKIVKQLNYYFDLLDSLEILSKYSKYIIKILPTLFNVINSSIYNFSLYILVFKVKKFTHYCFWLGIILYFVRCS